GQTVIKILLSGERFSEKRWENFIRLSSMIVLVWLAIQSASQKWTVPLKDWRMAMSRFITEFGDRLSDHL
ncbi:hypothetical protein ACKKLJ_005087, partial [Escherichia coli]